MLHLLLIISYGALLLLLMPATGMGIISTAVMLAIGIGLIVCKKFHKEAFRKHTQFFLIPVALLVAATFGRVFYNRWLPSSKMLAIATMLHIPVELMLLTGSLILSGLSVCFLFVLLQMIVKKVSDTSPQNDLVKNLLFCIVASMVTVILAQVMVDTEAFSMGYLKFLWGTLIVSVVILFIYCLTGRMILSISF